MSEAKIHIVTQGVLGGNVSFRKKVGFMAVYIDDYDVTSPDRIILDAFIGQGPTFRACEETHIVVEDKGKIIFRGNKKEFMECIRFGYEVRNLKV